jgi:hypothetical protein
MGGGPRDWNEILAYSTVKLVRVHDKRLGLLHRLFQLLIIGYVIGIVVLLNKEYLLTTAPEGTVRVGLRRPDPCVTAGVPLHSLTPRTLCSHRGAAACPAPPLPTATVLTGAPALPPGRPGALIR